MIAFSFRAIEWYGSRQAMMEAINSGEEKSNFNMPWGLAGEFPDIPASGPIQKQHFDHALAVWIDVAIEQEYTRQDLETAEALDEALDFGREALRDPPATTTKVERCQDGTVVTETYHADGRCTWDIARADGTHRQHNTRWRWDR